MARALRVPLTIVLDNDCVARFILFGDGGIDWTPSRDDHRRTQERDAWAAGTSAVDTSPGARTLVDLFLVHEHQVPDHRGVA